MENKEENPKKQLSGEIKSLLRELNAKIKEARKLGLNLRLHESADVALDDTFALEITETIKY